MPDKEDKYEQKTMTELGKGISTALALLGEPLPQNIQCYMAAKFVSLVRFILSFSGQSPQVVTLIHDPVLVSPSLVIILSLFRHLGHSLTEVLIIISLQH